MRPVSSPPAAVAAPGRRDPRRRITLAAMDLFEERGYVATTVETIAERAGISRRTFFHHFASKDAVVLPDHASLIERLESHLAEQDASPPVEAVGGALRMVLASYLADPELALRRHQITRQTPELREREIAWVQRYQLMFSRYLDRRYATAPQGGLAADVVAAGLVAVHNHVLRQWLTRGSGSGDPTRAGSGDAARTGDATQGLTRTSGDAMQDLDAALRWFSHSVRLATRGDAPRRLVVAVFDDDVDPADIAAQIDTARSASESLPSPVKNRPVLDR
jgi:AcrR family transcriptional regulator